MKSLKVYLLLIFLSLVPTILIWLPFILKLESFWHIPLLVNGMATIVANYGGPLYIVVAKTLYNASLIKNNFQFNLPVEYYAAHFPLFPLLIKIPALLIGYPWAMLVVTLLSSFFAIYFFYKFISQYQNQKNSFFLTFLFAIFPARFLIVRSVGSPEPLFIGSVIASIYYFQNKKYLKSGVFGVIAQLTKSPGIILFLALFISFLHEKLTKIAQAKGYKSWEKLIDFKYFPIFLIPISLLGVFYFHHLSMGNFFAYFNSGDNIHLLFPPFQIFNYAAPWVGTFWLEEEYC